MSSQTYPARPVRVIVPFPAGGSMDLLGRTFGHKLEEFLGKPFIVENRSGAGGRIGTEAVASAAPDGYTIGIVAMSGLSIVPHVLIKPPYDPLKAFAPISKLVSVSALVAVSGVLPVNTLKELIALEKKTPGKLNYGSVGVGSQQHFFGLNVNALTGMNLVHVPFRGTAPALLALISGEVHVMFDVLAGLQTQNFQTGKLKALAVASPTRIPQMPNVPTSAEAGVPGMEMNYWFVMIGPAGLPREIVNALNAQTQKALASPDVIDTLATKQGYVLAGGTPEALGALIESETRNWGRIIKASGYKPE